jgi:hypothetical protein
MPEPLTPEQIEHRKALAATLRSGAYTRGYGQLEYAEETEAGGIVHCCLGVATREAEKDGVPLGNVSPKDGLLTGCIPNRATTAYYGFTLGEEHRLASMNDHLREGGPVCSWTDIAAWIENGRYR